MIDINAFMKTFIEALTKAFENRVWFAGLQGSYGRGEAVENSDIDVVVILDKLSAEDIRTYNQMLDTLPHRDLICGFLSGKEEILNWETSDLFQFFNDTNPIIGSLKELLPLIDDDAVERAIKNAVCNIYHGCVHNMLIEKSHKILRSLYKNAFFAVQAIAFKESGRYIRHQNNLLEAVSPKEQEIIKTYIEIKESGKIRFDEMSETLFEWASDKITSQAEKKNEK